MITTPIQLKYFSRNRLTYAGPHLISVAVFVSFLLLWPQWGYICAAIYGFPGDQVKFPKNLRLEELTTPNSPKKVSHSQLD